MFGIKTKIIEKYKSSAVLRARGKLSNDISIESLMKFFVADTFGHRANVEKGDLGYGWIHYGFVRTIKPKKILCVGSRYGYIPAVLAQACRDNGIGHVDFVDAGFGSDDKNHWTGVGYWKTPKGKKSFETYGLKKWITLHVTITEKFAKSHKDNYDYIYIDGDHSYNGVLRDYKLFWPRLKKDGFMGFHDVSVKGKLPEGEYGVHKLWNSIAKKNSIIFPFSGSGLGIIQKQ